MAVSRRKKTQFCLNIGLEKNLIQKKIDSLPFKLHVHEPTGLSIPNDRKEDLLRSAFTMNVIP